MPVHCQVPVDSDKLSCNADMEIGIQSTIHIAYLYLSGLWHGFTTTTTSLCHEVDFKHPYLRFEYLYSNLIEAKNQWQQFVILVVLVLKDGHQNDMCYDERGRYA